jgi:two-component system chemotaxis response regulator CheB
MAGAACDRRPAIVALVCSVGGLDALSRVLGPLEASFPAAIIVLQHQSPTHSSRLPSILARRCALPVHDAVDDAALEPGHVVVVPSGHHALVTSEGSLALIASDGTPPYRPSADLLLTSMALVAPKRSIAVILSGVGHDGATGATALHDFGGVVIAASKESSTYFAMPQAAIDRDEIVDYVVSVDDMAGLLAALVTARDDFEVAEPESA